MTYLDIVNAVMRRLREDEVTTVSESDYSRLVGDFVNDAKRTVEDAWDWTALRTTYNITTTSGTSTYPLTGFGVRGKVLYVHNLTTNAKVKQESLQRIRDMNLAGDTPLGDPRYYALNGADSNGDVNLVLHYTPSGTYNLEVYTVKRTADLSSDTDELLIPSSPVVQWAYSYALRERGETGGQSAAEQALFAQNDMATTIALDAGLHPEETIWTYV